MARYAASGSDDLLDGEAAAVAEVLDHLVAGGEGVEGEDVGVGEVGDVNVVANAGAVGGRSRLRRWKYSGDVPKQHPR